MIPKEEASSRALSTSAGWLPGMSPLVPHSRQPSLGAELHLNQREESFNVYHLEECGCSGAVVRRLVHQRKARVWQAGIFEKREEGVHILSRNHGEAGSER